MIKRIALGSAFFEVSKSLHRTHRSAESVNDGLAPKATISPVTRDVGTDGHEVATLLIFRDLDRGDAIIQPAAVKLN
jgi:hypothetical protein